MIKVIIAAGVGILAYASLAAAQTLPQIPPNTLNCDGFAKMANGQWFALPTNSPFELGNVHQFTIRNSNIPPRGFNIGGFDLYTVIQQKCAGSAI